MSMVSDISTMASQLSQARLAQAVGVQVAKKTLDAAKAEGAAAVKLLDAALDIARQSVEGQGARPTMGAVVSGLGTRLDVYA
jgi:hypothetical protein